MPRPKSTYDPLDHYDPEVVEWWSLTPAQRWVQSQQLWETFLALGGPSPIAKVLSTFRKHRVRALLMGGQACVVYGAAEFTRNVDLAVLADESNLARLQSALADASA